MLGYRRKGWNSPSTNSSGGINLNRMMCETLFKLHEQGKLDTFLPKLDATPTPPDRCILQGAITIEEPEK